MKKKYVRYAEKKYTLQSICQEAAIHTKDTEKAKHYTTVDIAITWGGRIIDRIRIKWTKKRIS